MGFLFAKRSKNAEYRKRDEELARKFKSEKDLKMNGCTSLYYYVDENTLRHRYDFEEDVLYAAWKRAKDDFIKLCGYGTFSEFRDGEGNYDIEGIDLRNMEGYIDAHPIPGEEYQLQFENTVHIKINGTKYHPPVETTVTLNENEIPHIKVPTEDEKRVDYLMFMDSFEATELNREYMNRFLAIEAYVNHKPFTPISKHDPKMVRNLERKMDEYHEFYTPNEIERKCYGNSRFGPPHSESTRKIAFINENRNETYCLTPPEVHLPRRGGVVQFDTCNLNKCRCREIGAKKAIFLLESLLKQVPCILDGDYGYTAIKYNWDEDKIKEMRVGTDFSFDTIMTEEGNTIRIEDLPPIEELVSGKAHEKFKENDSLIKE